MWSILFFISVTVLVHPPTPFSSFFSAAAAREARPSHPYATGNFMLSPSRFLSHLSILPSPFSVSLDSFFFTFFVEARRRKKRRPRRVHRRGNQRGRCIFVGTLPPPRNALVLSRYTRNTRERCRTIVSGALKFPRLHAPVDPP